MRAISRLPRLTAAFLAPWLLLSPAFGQSPPPQTRTDPEVVPDDDLTLVVGTRFVAPSANETTARAQFTGARIPLSAFNETDECVDQRALEVTRDYFATLGRALGKAGHYYFVPEAEVRSAISECEKLHGRPPQAWVDNSTKVIAFGKVVPTAEAPELEKSVR